MARRGNTAQAEAPAEVTTNNEVQEDTVSTATPESADSTSKDKKPEVEIDLSGFKAAVEAAVTDTEARDATTGELPETLIEPVNAEFRKLEGAKPKNKARQYLNDQLREAMNQRNLPLARSYMLLADKLTASGGGGGKTERQPADPTEAFVQRVVGLELARTLASGNVPEGVSEDWREKANSLLAESTEAANGYLAWVTSDAEDKGDEPEVSAVVKAAVKLSLGKAAKVGGRQSSGGGGGAGDGVRRDIGKHILNAFADKESGTFLTVAQIRAVRSEEYGDNPPSAGAISARLFPDSGKPCTVEGITPGQNEKSHKGATKN
jgi:hypothetical protein